MSFFRLSKTTIVGALLTFSLISPASAYETEDVLGQFLEQNLASTSVQENNPYANAQPYAPTTIQQQATYAGPLLNAQSALIMNANTGQVLYHKNMDSVRSIASISKMMAAMVLLDARLNMNELVTITPDEIDRLKGTGSRLSIGTTLTRNQLLHIGLMSSENRAIHALGRTYPGGMGAFVAAMNRKAQSLGMSSTRFYEPTGLDSRNVSTARDLSIMVRAANKYPQIRQLSTSNYGSVYTSAGKTQNYKNSNALVREGQWNISVQKTGYIREAGRSMVLQAQMGREPVVIVVLGSSTSASRVNDARTLSSMLYQQSF
ncbi:D-alanyl-D-alanine carboxypeptidase family protein [Neisseriaceae bacterium B1]